MSRQIEEGSKSKLKGKARETFGKLTNDKSEQIRGKLEQADGETRRRVGVAKVRIDRERKKI